MTPDVDLTVRPPGPRVLRDRLLAADCRLFEAVAARHWPGGDRLLPRLSRSANHGVLWFATAAAIAATRQPAGPPGRRPRASPRSPSPRRRSTPSASARSAARARYWTPSR